MASRKLKPLSLKEKLNILVIVDKDPKRKQIETISEQGLPASVVNTIWSKHKDIAANTVVFGARTKQPTERGTAGSPFKLV